MVKPGQGEDLEFWRAELLTSRSGVTRMTDAIVRQMEAPDLSVAGNMAAVLAAFRSGSRWYPPKTENGSVPTPARPWPESRLSIAKLRHDAEQFSYLRSVGRLNEEFDGVIKDYLNIADRMTPLGINNRIPLSPEDEARIGHVYNRIVHIAAEPRIHQALSSTWDRDAVQGNYLNIPPGIVVVDNFLSAPALDGLRRFCLESTVWSGNRYADGRLGAFFFSGFNCPLLMQLAEEIRDAFPKLIGSEHPLRQLWGFKNAPYLPGDTTIHADFAAVNVNFWITPESANLDQSSGGLVVYDVAAPLWWDFKSYNERPDLIRSYLRERHAKAITIPYRANRAIIFNSDLFHATAEIRFRSEFENRRINITMLFGDRQHDSHHLVPLRANATDPLPAAYQLWRSRAFSQARSRRQ
jgi:hypothetical protein